MVMIAASVIQAQTPSPTPTPNEPFNKKTDPAVQTADGNKKEKEKDKKDDPKQPGKEKNGSWILAPIPIKSPAFGAGLIAAVGYVFKLNPEDKLSPPSTIGAAFPFTNNGSRGLVVGGRLYFAENKYQTAFAAGKGRANYEYFGIGRIVGEPSVSVLMKQSGAFVFGEFMRNFGNNLFIGPRYQYRRLSARIDERETDGGFEIPAIDVRSTTAAIGFHVQRDQRDSVFYPTKGSLFDVKADFFGKALGSNRTYQTYTVAYNVYRKIGKGQVLAYRAMGCSASENAPFFDLCFFGRSDLRGYTAGRFQNHRMFATQAEYRRELPWRLGIVAFGGVGGVAPGWNDFRFDKLLPAIGAGLRFKLDKKNHINYRIDVGYGRTGPTLTMSVTEAF